MARGEKNNGIRWGFWFRVVLWCGASVSVLVAATKVRQFALRDPRFTLASPDDRVGGLEMQGLMYTSRSKVLNTFDHDFGRSVFSLPLAERRRRLLGIDWVEDASVSRVWPNRLMVRVTERKPVAFVNLPRPRGRDGRVVLIDGDGVLLDQPPQSTFTFPVLSGIYEEQSEAERRRRVRAMLRLLAELGPLAKDVSEVNARVTEDLRVVAQVDKRTIELLVGDRNFSSRVQNFASRYAEVRRRSPNATIFDLRLDDRITARE
jgi:cell division protein FtsQ